MIDKNIELLERDNEQDTGEEQSNVSTAEDLPGSFMLRCAMTILQVALVIASTKFLVGAWIVVVLIPLLVVMILGSSHHYRRVERDLTTSLPLHQKEIRHCLIVQKYLSEDERPQMNVIEPSGRSFLCLLLDYIHTIQHQHPGDTLMVVLPEPAESL